MSGTAMRVLTVLEMLQARDRITGVEIAEQLEVDSRSVRRYIKQLQEMGIPVESERGRYGAYRLETGYRLPPLMFQDDEITAIIVGLMVIRAFQFPLAPTHIAGALAKIKRSVPKQFFNKVQAIQDVMHFYATPNEINVERQIMSVVASSAWQTITIKFTYQSRNDDETERQFDPYGVVYYQQDWYTVGFCHLRTDIRIFRLDRISNIETTDQTFTPRPDFDVLDYVVDALSAPNGYQVEVVFDTTLDKAQRSMPPRLGTFEVVEGGILFRCSALRLDWIAALMLSLDFPIRIIQPQALRDELRALAQKALKIIES